MPAHPATPGAALSSALALAADGFAVFPCLRNKAPACTHGHLDAASDPADVRALWRRWPGPLIGIATGEPSGLAVLDLDAKHPEARDWWGEHRAMLPETRTVRTRSRGLHLYFRHAAGLRCSVGKIGPGIDVRAEGGYVIAWAAAGLPVLLDVPMVPWPAWLAPPEPDRPQRPPEPARVPDDDAAGRLLRFVRAAPEGERNKRLFWAGCRMAGMVASRLMGGGEAEKLLADAAQRIGLPDIEAARTIKSALAAGGR
jgi:hypothetical protein